MPHRLVRRTRICGIDFSGARDAGKRIWIASGSIDGDVLRVDACCQARELPGSAKALGPSLSALRAFIAQEKTAAVGMDFPFGLPQALVAGKASWEDVVRSFPDDYPSAGALRQHCRREGGVHELKRETDRESRTPFSPYNLRLYRQTYYGIRDVLHPLVRDGLASVLPMQRASPDRPWAIEVCPASTLKAAQIPAQRYKRRSDEGWETRRRILEAIEAKGILDVPDPQVRAKVLDDPGGDALDSIIAAFATFRAVRDPVRLARKRAAPYALEGYVYV